MTTQAHPPKPNLPSSTPAQKRAPTDVVALKERLSTLSPVQRLNAILECHDVIAVVRALPLGLDGGKAEPIVRDALAELSESGGTHALDERSDAIFARLACHGSVRAGQALSDAEIRALLRSLDAIDLGAHCPHGRPVVRSVSYDELASWFDRG